MKKTLIALSVLVAAGSVNAAEVYSKDGVTVSVGGAAEIQLMKDYTEDSDADIRLDDGELNFNVSVAVTDSVNAIAQFDFEFEDRDTEGAGSNTKNTELYAGFEGDFGTVTFGRMYTYGDDKGIGEDYELGVEQISFGEDHGSSVIKYHFSNDMFYAGIAHNLGNDQKTDNFEITDGVVGITVSGFDARIFAMTQDKTTAGKTTEERDGYNLEVVYSFSDFSAGASYGGQTVDNGTTEVDSTFTEIVGTYTMGKNTFALGAVWGEEENVDGSAYYANVTHQMHSNVRLYAEIGNRDTDKKDSNGKAIDYDFGYLAGMEVKF